MTGTSNDDGEGGTPGKRGERVRFGTSAELTGKGMQCLRQWRREPKAAISCPHCGAPGVEIIDRSSRPMAEWYAFRCAACGFDDALSLPMTIHRSL